MLDAENPGSTDDETAVTPEEPTTPPQASPEGTEGPARPAKRAARKTAEKATAKKAAAKKTTAKRTTKKAVAAEEAPAEPDAAASAEAAGKPKKKAAAKAPAKPESPAVPEALFQVPQTPVTQEQPSPGRQAPDAESAAEDKPVKKATRKRAAKKAAEPAAGPDSEPASSPETPEAATEPAQPDQPAEKSGKSEKKSGETKGKKKAGKKTAAAADSEPEAASTTEAPAPGSEADAAGQADAAEPAEGQADEETTDSDGGEGSARRRPRRRGGRRRRGRGGNGDHSGHGEGSEDGSGEGHEDSGSGDGPGKDSEDADGEHESGEGGSRRRRQRQRKPRNIEDEITGVQGSTRLEAKKQRRREGREAGRRRAPIVSEAEFLARRESVDRLMVIRQKDDLTQIGVLEDNVLVEHYVSRQSQTSLIGNVYLGRVQNVLPSMEAAFVDIGKGRNAVIYAGEVNWSALGHKEGQPRKIESVLSSGQTILVQVTKDPIGHKGARLTGQISLPGRFLVYVPDGNTSGISRKLPDTERHRLKTLLKQIVPDSAGVIVRTAAEGASEEELTRDVERLTARWNDIEAKVKIGKSPELLYGEPDLTLKVVRDLFTEDFTKLVVQGDDAWDLVEGYVSHVAPDLKDRLERFEPDESGKDLFAAYRVDEQIAKGLGRKVWLPSGGSLIIDRTEAMTVIDVNTGKFTGSGGNLEETVTKNNLEAAEEVVRQLRLRDIGGIIVIDFIDMVLESNRDLVLRRLVECLGRDRTRHQVAEVTSLGLVQMTRKRIGTGLVESFSEECSHCKGRGVVMHDHPIEHEHTSADDEPRRGRGRGGHGGHQSSRGRGRGSAGNGTPQPSGLVKPPSPADLAGTRPKPPADEQTLPVAPVDGGSAPSSGPSPTPQQTPGPQTAEQATGQASGQAGAPGPAPAGPPASPAEPAAVAEESAAASAEPPATPAGPSDADGTRSAAGSAVADVPANAQDEQPADQPADQPPGQPAGQPAEMPEAPGEPAGRPAAPTVVTTTRRRRTATRPAGPPAPVSGTPETLPGASTESSESLSPESRPETAGDASSGATGSVNGGADDGARDRASDGFDNGIDSGAGNGLDVEVDDEDAAVLHVPVKRKGTRKR